MKELIPSKKVLKCAIRRMYQNFIGRTILFTLAIWIINLSYQGIQFLMRTWPSIFGSIGTAFGLAIVLIGLIEAAKMQEEEEVKKENMEKEPQ